MPIDPDAYMAGAIPALSWGGSFQAPVHSGTTSTDWQSDVLNAESFAGRAGKAPAVPATQTPFARSSNKMQFRSCPPQTSAYMPSVAGPRRTRQNTEEPRPRIAPMTDRQSHRGSPNIPPSQQDYFNLIPGSMSPHSANGPRPHCKKAESLPSPVATTIPSPQHRAVNLARSHDTKTRRPDMARRHTSDTTMAHITITRCPSILQVWRKADLRKEAPSKRTLFNTALLRSLIRHIER